jgi:hypothetical protein
MAFGVGSVAPAFFDGFDVNTGQFLTRVAAFTDISGFIAGSQLPAFTGDVTKPLGSTVQTLANIPNDTNVAGDLLFNFIATPATPGSGLRRVYCATSGGQLNCLDSGGGISGTAYAKAAVASNWLRSFDPTTGAFTASQPAFTDISGSIAGSQLPAFTGDVTKPSGSTVQTLANIPNDTPAAGDILFTNIAAPSSPAAGKARVYTDSTTGNLCSKTSAGTVSHGVQTATFVSTKFVQSIDDSGSCALATPNYSDLIGNPPWNLHVGGYYAGFYSLLPTTVGLGPFDFGSSIAWDAPYASTHQKFTWDLSGSLTGVSGVLKCEFMVNLAAVQTLFTIANPGTVRSFTTGTNSISVGDRVGVKFSVNSGTITGGDLDIRIVMAFTT